MANAGDVITALIRSASAAKPLAQFGLVARIGQVGAERGFLRDGGLEQLEQGEARRRRNAERDVQ